MQTHNPPTFPSERTVTRTGITSIGQNEPRGLLLVASSRTVTDVVTFGPEAVLTVGRGEGATVRLADPTLSRVHARFRRTGDAVIVTDLASRNGTMLEGRRITEARLTVGRSVLLGSVTVELRAAPARDAVMLGIADYGELRARLEDELVRARDFRRPLSLLLMRPQERLKASDYATEVRSVLRVSDRIGLYDRHSLMVVMPECDAEGAETVLRSIEAAAPSGVVLKVGAASYPSHGLGAERLIGLCLEAVAGTRGEAPPPTARVIGGEAQSSRGPAMQDVARLVEKLAPTRISVLVSGETGVGKELVARSLHDKSPRRRGPFIAVNCGAIPEKLVESTFFGHVEGAFTGADHGARGLFERASGGTVFLDEVGELSPAAQTALLRVLDTGRFRLVGAAKETEVDVRVIAATHRDLRAASAAGAFRPDLYHRLSGTTIAVPPLRERRSEIPDLARHFLQSSGGIWGRTISQIAPEALALLQGYSWPGNVRELRNVIERAVALAETDAITSDDLPPNLTELSGVPAPLPADIDPAPPAAPLDLRAEVERYERGLIERALQLTGGHQRKAAELLRLPLRTLERRLQRIEKGSPPSE